MLENDNLLMKFWLHITSNISKKQTNKLKNHGIAPTPLNLPTLKAYPTPRVGDGFILLLLLKWRERMSLKIPGAIFPLCCAFLSTRVKTVWGQPPFRELGLSQINKIKHRYTSHLTFRLLIYLQLHSYNSTIHKNTNSKQ